MIGSEVLQYILLGLALSIPIGPINIKIVNQGLKDGFWNSWLVGIGGMAADLILMFLIYFGLSERLTTTTAQAVMWVFGAVVLSYLGYESIRDAQNTTEFGTAVEADGGRQESLSRSFVSGFLIAISNPLNLIFWIGIYGSVLAATLDQAGIEVALLYSASIFIGIASWDLGLATATHYGRQFVTAKLLRYFSVGAGLLLIGFGMMFAYYAIDAIIL
ncbi:LysE family translocator [Natrinema pallidum]|uniref:Lysine transporter LysE n=1 Tax=Natrinema pallidum TaxID=69527 RepID=A0A4P9TBE3_9EURY|nr:LysE family transporter [Natrinema pallidum]QCW01958.1 lysine transporter LysE [Natrinema pallidum]